MDFGGKVREWVTKSKADVVSGTVKLAPDEVSVIATIPLADADTYDLELPDTPEAFDRDYVIIGVRASGSYVDGEVQVTAPTGVQFALPTIDAMKASGSRLRIRNVRGRYYAVDEDSFTV